MSNNYRDGLPDDDDEPPLREEPDEDEPLLSVEREGV
jgi:hypothetical protein